MQRFAREVVLAVPARGIRRELRLRERRASCRGSRRCSSVEQHQARCGTACARSRRASVTASALIGRSPTRAAPRCRRTRWRAPALRRAPQPGRAANQRRDARRRKHEQRVAGDDDRRSASRPSTSALQRARCRARASTNCGKNASWNKRDLRIEDARSASPVRKSLRRRSAAPRRAASAAAPSPPVRTRRHGEPQRGTPRRPSAPRRKRAARRARSADNPSAAASACARRSRTTSRRARRSPRRAPCASVRETR